MMRCYLLLLAVILPAVSARRTVCGGGRCESGFNCLMEGEGDGESHCIRSICFEPLMTAVQTGNYCNTYTKKYYYDKDNGVCKHFYYNRCGGNSNNFNSIEECSDQCSKHEPTK
ncbi:kunitz-type U19-barytoxin-Tl1a [Lingula anatina]|uniref:Kunitz-type U19-barytoxin-Tl1a n=1 Tax=Lingula anatina TaxID=7574 RepID=A0A1S3KGF2_LINAN|nr:kunitz-type U19-barytoxin-Tl1a [Lingula anatina]|eukprot:XP_013421567.1 kunitz-type U19-barytoxin-Tl1a [Lingula anatina]